MSVICQLCNRGLGSLNILPPASCTVISVRWRKPRTIPRAPSKLYAEVKPKPPVDPEERKKLQQLKNNYNATVRALRGELLKIYKQKKVLFASEMKEEKEAAEEEWNRMLSINEEWNKTVGVGRQRRQEEEALVKREKLAKLEEAVKLEKEFLSKQAEERLSFEIGQADNLITPDNVDDVIERVLNQRVNYEYAFDPDEEKIISSSAVKSTPKVELSSLKLKTEDLDTGPKNQS